MPQQTAGQDLYLMHTRHLVRLLGANPNEDAPYGWTMLTPACRAAWELLSRDVMPRPDLDG